MAVDRSLPTISKTPLVRIPDSLYRPPPNPGGHLSLVLLPSCPISRIPILAVTLVDLNTAKLFSLPREPLFVLAFCFRLLEIVERLEDSKTEHGWICDCSPTRSASSFHCYKPIENLFRYLCHIVSFASTQEEWTINA